MMKRYSVLIAILIVGTLAFAEGTRTWQQSKFDDFEKGTSRGVAIRSDGGLELAPAFTPRENSAQDCTRNFFSTAA